MPPSPSQPAPAPKVLIEASAGSGKTFQLTSRFLQLALAGVPPERIAALTFTRAAAGEFSSAILRKLASAAQHPTARHQLGGRQLSEAACLDLLASLTSQLHRLTLGTLDSFFTRIIRAFPHELGLASGFELMDALALSSARQSVLARMFERSPTARPAHHQPFLDAFDQATWGEGETRLAQKLESFLAQSHRLFLEFPDAARWGDPVALWGQEGTALRFDSLPSPTEIPAILAGALAASPSPPFTDAAKKCWREVLPEIAYHQPGATAPSGVWTMLPKLTSHYPHFPSQLTLSIRKEYTLCPSSSHHVAQLVRRFMAGELARALGCTQGLALVLHEFEANYSQQVRRRGQLTFSDLDLILAGLLGGAAGIDRLDLDYRLDAQFDHWLLDEFQDTSRSQWQAIENLVDEAAQDPSGRRGFYIVGDQKQALYGWRGGEVALFDEIRQRYADGLVVEPLDVSYRSCPAVISMVNRIFGDPACLSSFVKPDALARWDWRDHRSAHPSLSGFATLLWTPTELEDEGCSEALAALLQRVDPISIGMSCAVLVQKNDRVIELANFLRARLGQQVQAGSSIRPAADAPLGSALLSLLQLAAHPADSHAWNHLQMTPGAASFISSFPDAHSLSSHVRGSIARQGYEATLQTWAARIGGDNPPGDFASSRLDLLLKLARGADASSRPSIDAFIDLAKAFEFREPVTAGSIRVMTIHNSKGLTFDMVCCLDLGQPGRIRDAPCQLRDNSPSARPSTVVSLPRKEIATSDPTLNRLLKQREAEAQYESLCKFYVALTRPRRALYLFAPLRKEKSSARSFTSALEAALGRGEPPSHPALQFGGPDVLIASPHGDPSWMETATPHTPQPSS